VLGFFFFVYQKKEVGDILLGLFNNYPEETYSKACGQENKILYSKTMGN